MRQDISRDMVVQALLRDGVLGFRDKGAFLREGVCPNCQKKSLFVQKAQPWQAMCSGEVNRGYTESVRNLLPSLFSEFAKKYPPKPRKTHGRRWTPTSGLTVGSTSGASGAGTNRPATRSRTRQRCSPRCSFTLISHTADIGKGSSAQPRRTSRKRILGAERNRTARSTPGMPGRPGPDTRKEQPRLHRGGNLSRNRPVPQRLQGDRVPFFRQHPRPRL